MSKILSLALVLLAACGGAETPTETADPQPEAAIDDPHAVCVQAFRRQRECTDEYLPALVDARVRNDVPQGIAAQDAELGRDELVARAREEWTTDSTDDAIDQTCTKMVASMPPEQQHQATQRVGECLGADACGAFVDCVMPVIESQLR